LEGEKMENGFLTNNKQKLHSSTEGSGELYRSPQVSEKVCSFVEVKPLVHIIKLVLQSAYLKNERYPLNLLLIAPPESLKTLAIESFKFEGTYTTKSITRHQLVNKIFPMIEHQKLKHLIITDLTTITEKDIRTQKALMNTLKNLIEEGVDNIDDFNVRTQKTYNPPLKVGVITAITDEDFLGYYNSKEGKWIGGVKYEWRRIGLLSRFIPFSYRYEYSKIFKIFEWIEHEQYNLKLPSQKIKTRRTTFVEGNPELFSKLEKISVQLSQQVGGYGFRPQRSLQTLAKANALLNGRCEVVMEDIDTVIWLSNWINLDFNPL
jgi:hypothetical protein